MKVRYLFVPIVFILLFQGFVVSSVGEEYSLNLGERSTDLVEGQYSLYIVKEIIETTSDWTSVEWIQGPHVIAIRHKVVEGADAPEFYCSVSGLGVHAGKRQYDTTKVVIQVEALVLRRDITAIVNIEKGALGYTKVQLSAYDTTASNFVNLGEFLNGAHGPEDFELELSTLYEMPSGKANVEEAIRDLEKKVFSFYYPWYASPEGPSGLWFHWTRVTEESIANSAHYPLLGAYDSADEGVLLAHMAIAKHAGIEGFIVSWWGMNTFEDNQIRRILGVAEQIGLQISLYYESVRDITQDDIVEELTYVVNSYADNPSFLKDSGRPVVFIYAVPHSERDPSFWLEVRRRVEANVGPVVLIGDTVDEEYLHVFDGFHVYICLAVEDGGKQYYSDVIEGLEIGPSKMDIDEVFSLAYSGEEVDLDIKSFSVTVIPGYDDTEVRDPGIEIGREEGEVYARFWGTAMDLDAHSVLITSWNEWHEGTEIEPSREYGFEYVNMTRLFIEEYKQSSIPMPEADFSVTVESLTQYPDLTGDGSIVLAAAEISALYVNVSVSSEDGISSLDLQGDFYAYLKNQNGNTVSVVIPSVPSQSEVVVRVAYEAESTRPLFNISVTAYDVLGRLYELYKGQLRPTIEQATPPVISLLLPENKIYPASDVSLTFTVSEPISWIGYSLDEQANRTIGGNATLTSLLDGSHHIIVYANDTAGNMGASNKVYFTVDTTPPTITDITRNPSVPDDGEEVTVTATVTDQHSGVNTVTLSYRIDGGSWVNTPMTKTTADIYQATIPGQSAETNVEYQIAANDVAGRQTTEDNAGSYYVYRVIPEFPSFVILPLFIIATLLAVALTKVFRGKEITRSKPIQQ